ncbi:MAG: alanine--tRNA ligase [Elusimicrobia bacterium]|nr:alanine--tRNA ligase [Elusimicrobiota bacterium]
MQSSELRSQFLNYFKKQGHKICPSSPLIPQGDPTLLFTSAGMVPFKPYFLGIKKDLNRAASVQKCLRTTDIDHVGTTIRHLTFFEMLGNFSFGDYFKEEAIAWGWGFLTKEMKLPQEKLFITLFKEDDESAKLWKKFVPESKITRLGEDSNFWAMGPTGPCGPCSEIYWDRGTEFSCGQSTCGVGCDCDRYLEIWNLVFTQFDRQEDGSLKPLPRKNIDTGMGLERLALVTQQKKTPFETDLFWPILEETSKILKTNPPASPAGRQPLTPFAELRVPAGTPKGPSVLAPNPFHIIGDHTRAACFLAAEGILPSNEGRGYILRRLLRRALRYGRLLGYPDSFLHRLVSPTLKIFSEEKGIQSAQKQIEDTFRTEEENFLSTLENGERLLKEILAKPGTILPGEEVFKLYDTFGFPLELTVEAAQVSGKKVDLEEYERAKTKAQEIARTGWKGSGERRGDIYSKVSRGWPHFVGYELLDTETEITDILDDSGNAVSSLSAGSHGEIFFKETPFYAEGGGQVGDRGWILDSSRTKKLAEVLDTYVPVEDYHSHKIKALSEIKKGQEVYALVSKEHRHPTMYHHTATHLLNEALRRVLGPNIRQAGSLVDAVHLRFDFTYPKALSYEQIKLIEDIVNDVIRKDFPVHKQAWPKSKVQEWKPATLLGEDYGDKPRFVLVGKKKFEEPDWQSQENKFSLELCGGTHVDHTGEIQHFKILKDSSISAGTRRIEALAGPAVLEYYKTLTQKQVESLGLNLKKLDDVVAEIFTLLGGSKKDLFDGTVSMIKDLFKNYQQHDSLTLEDLQVREKKLREALETVITQEKKLRQELGILKQKALLTAGDKNIKIQEINGIKLLSQKLEGVDAPTLRALCDRWRKENSSSVIFLVSTQEEKLSFVVSVTQDLLSQGFDSVKIAKKVAENLSGSAGGRPDFAQGGGKAEPGWEKVFDQMPALLKK